MPPRRLATPVFVYDDYVDYLRAWIDYAKRFGLTQGEFVKNAGIGAHAFLSDVLSGRKKIGRRHVAGFCEALELTGDASSYFTALVEKEISRRPEDKDKALRTLAALRERNLSAILKEKNLQYFAHWHYPVIREYIICKGSVSSPKEIVNALVNVQLSSSDVRIALTKLEKWGMIVHDPDRDVWIPAPDPTTISYGTIPHAVVNDVKRDMIEASVIAMETMEKGERHVSMAIRGVSPQTYRRFCEKIDQLRQEFLETEADSGATEQVMALNVQLFPLARINRNTGDATINDAAGGVE